MKAGDIMTTKVITVTRDTTIEEIARTMTENNISGVPVVEYDRVVGIVTQKDLLYKDMEPRFPGVFELLGGIFYIEGDRYNEELKKVTATKAEHVMTRDVVTVGKDEEIEQVAELMVDNGINRIPVIENGKLAGIISRGDLVKYIGKRT